MLESRYIWISLLILVLIYIAGLVVSFCWIFLTPDSKLGSWWEGGINWFKLVVGLIGGLTWPLWIYPFVKDKLNPPTSRIPFVREMISRVQDESLLPVTDRVKDYLLEIAKAEYRRELRYLIPSVDSGQKVMWAINEQEKSMMRAMKLAFIKSGFGANIKLYVIWPEADLPMELYI